MPDDFEARLAAIADRRIRYDQDVAAQEQARVAEAQRREAREQAARHRFKEFIPKVMKDVLARASAVLSPRGYKVRARGTDYGALSFACAVVATKAVRLPECVLVLAYELPGDVVAMVKGQMLFPLRYSGQDRKLVRIRVDDFDVGHAEALFAAYLAGAMAPPWPGSEGSHASDRTKVTWLSRRAS